MTDAVDRHVPHDLPEYRPNVDPSHAPWRRVRVFYEPAQQRWNWVHVCPWHKTPVLGHGYFSLRIAYMYAVAHLGSCL